MLSQSLKLTCYIFCLFNFGLRRERNFFGSRHGKGPSDGVSGVVKTAVRRAVISREATLATAENMYDFCFKNLTKTDCRKQRRVFMYVGDDEVNRERPQRDVKTAQRELGYFMPFVEKNQESSESVFLVAFVRDV